MSEGEQLQSEIGQSAIAGGSNVTSDCNASSNAWNVNFNNGYFNPNNKNNTNRVRPVARLVEAGSSATSNVVYDIPFSQIIEAWLNCEQNKRTSNSCVKFRWHAPQELVALWQQVRSATYKPTASMCFIVTHPVVREVFAGSFRDRVIHHWEAIRLVPILERFFVAVGDASMNCRKGYGSLEAVRRMERMIWDYTEGYSRNDCYIVGGDFSNYFMSIDKGLLWHYGSELILSDYEGEDLNCFLYLCACTIFHRPQDNCFRRSPVEAWKPLPPRKSLLHCPPDRGMPIGNFPSQLWANFLGALFTYWVRFVKGYDAFLIFVDDFRLLVRSAEEGRRILAEIRVFLSEELHITLHPDKIYLQHYSKGTKMVGAVIKPRRTYISNRTRGSFIARMIDFNKRAAAASRKERIAMLAQLRATVNSYLGMMIHYSSYKIRRRIALTYILPKWGEFIYFENEFSRCVIRKRYNQTYTLRRNLLNHSFAEDFIKPVQ